MQRKPVSPLRQANTPLMTLRARALRAARQVNPLRLAVTALMTAIVFVLTRVVQVPTPAKGYIHLGDAGIFFTSLAFGPWIGAVAGGLGTALADLTSGPYAAFAPASLVIHGIEGWLAGWIWGRWSVIVEWVRSARARREEAQQQPARTPIVSPQPAAITGMIVSAFVGGICVVAGYFLVEALPFVLGPGAAFGELPLNIVQVVAGALVGIPLYLAVLQAYPPLTRHGRGQGSV